MIQELDLRLLGSFEAAVDGARIPADSWERKRGADLVKLLALSPEGCLDRDRVVECLWPHLDAEAGKANLHKAATIARNALGDREAIVLRVGQVALAPNAQVRSDAKRFEAEREPELYSGELLPEDRYEDWTEAPRERLRQIYLESLRGRGMWAELAAEEPGDEEAQRQLMRSLANGGNRHAAARQFRRLVDALAAAGLRPQPETLALYEEIARGPATIAPLREGPPFVGREAELRILRGALQRAATGRGGTILLCGEAGVGKTRIAEELLAVAAADGWTTLRGAGPPEHGAAYGPVSQALDRLLLERPDLAAAMPDATRAELVRICSALPGEAAPADPRSDRSRIFAAVAQLLTAATRERGVVFLIDDLEQADTATIELCAHLATTAAFERLLVLLAHRDATSDATLTRVRAHVLDRGLAAELRLGPLERDAAAQLIDAVAPAPPPPGTRSAIVERAGGLPFFLSELAAAVGPGGEQTVPDHLHEVVQARLGRIEAPARRALSIVAALGGTFTADELIAAAGCEEEEEVYAIIEAALESGAVCEDEGAYRFRHTLIREALAEGVAAHRRIAAHRDAARRLAERDARPGRIAAHLLQAGFESEAVPYLARAAAEAASVAAYADALELVELALPHAGSERRADLGALRADLLLSLGDARAPSAYAEAISSPGSRSEVELRVSQARALLAAGDIAGASAAIVELEAETVADRARLVFIRGMLAWFRGEIEAARRAAEAARPLAIEAGLAMEIEQSTQLHSAVAHSLGDWPAGLRTDLATTLRLPELAGTFFDAHHCSAEYELAASTPLRVRDAAAGLCDEADRAGARRPQAFALTVLGEAELAAGNVAEAERRLDAAARGAGELGASASECLARMRLAEVALAGDDRPAAEDLLAHATKLALDSAIPHHLAYLVFAARIAAAADARRAAAELAEAESLLAGVAKCAFCPMPFNLAAASAHGEAGRTDQALSYLARAERALPLWQTGLWPAAIADARARIALGADDRGRAEELLGEAIVAYEAAERPLERERAAARLAAITA